MGYYFVRGTRYQSTPSFDGFLGKNGYYVVRPDGWKRLMNEAEEHSDYSQIDAKNRDSKIPVNINRFLSIGPYPAGRVDLATARLKYGPRFTLEKSHYDYVISHVREGDLTFSIRQISGALIDDELLGSLFSCFLAGSKTMAFESLGEIFRLCDPPSWGAKWFSTEPERGGATQAAIVVSDIKDIEVTPEHIEILLRKKRRLSVSRERCSMADGHSWE